ncbi:MAG: hypothetical protein OXI59_12845 [Gemmatimonadota bacterium]|nr:hypothetical protein [Gemmatimonadota bacterium]
MNNKEEISHTDNAKLQNHFNQLRREFLDNRGKWLDRWLTTIAIFLTFFGIVVAVSGYFTYH